MWQLGFCLVVFRIWRGARWSAAKIAFTLAPVMIGAGVELGQAAGVVEGTFDVADLLASLAAAVVAAVFTASFPGRVARSHA